MFETLITHAPTRSLGALTGALLHLLARTQRRTVHRNLAFALPELSQRQRRRIARGVFRNYGRVLMETAACGWFSKEDVARRATVTGGEHLSAAIAAGRGVLAVSAHLGNWELAMQAMPCYFGQPLTAVVKRFKSERLERWVRTRRTRFGNSVLYKKGSLTDMTRILRSGGVLIMMVDMARHKDGIDIEFFGKKATATPAAAMLALRCRCPIVTSFSHHAADGRLIVQVNPAIEVRRSGDLRADLLENTQRITAAVEQAVRAHPDQWHWALKRWKDHYPDLYR